MNNSIYEMFYMKFIKMKISTLSLSLSLTHTHGMPAACLLEETLFDSEFFFWWVKQLLLVVLSSPDEWITVVRIVFGFHVKGLLIWDFFVCVVKNKKEKNITRTHDT